ncbi:hypothetical protein [Massilia glaciei]|uniref:Uncharacterized protein n=1 Tax=Massilia glaciei TaxID=1524097 RepID=A0A2U2H942_9BURK|nr:hypothetical protein [Massilia glaciei]PWF39108.1 hypothetical protein C7C56_027340 [Massilia glaciei]
MAIDAIVERLEGVDIGVSAADAENVELLYRFGDLLLRYRDWMEQECEKKFLDVLAFRWEEFTNQAPRDDSSFEVVNSTWLTVQAKAQEVEPSDYIHYRICFNGNGVLDVIMLRL